MSSNVEPTIWSRDIGQRIPCFDRFRLTITWMSNIKEGGYKCLCQPFSWRMAAMLRDSVVVVAVVRTRPRVIPLAMITTRKIHSWVSFSFLYEYGAPLGGLWAAGAPLLIYSKVF